MTLLRGHSRTETQVFRAFSVHYTKTSKPDNEGLMHKMGKNTKSISYMLFLPFLTGLLTLLKTHILERNTYPKFLENNNKEKSGFPPFAFGPIGSWNTLVCSL